MRQNSKEISQSPSYRIPLKKNKASSIVLKKVLKSNPTQSPENLKTEVNTTFKQLQLKRLRNPTDLLKAEQLVNQTIYEQTHSNDFFRMRATQQSFKPKPFVDGRHYALSNFDEFSRVQAFEQKKKLKLRMALENQIRSNSVARTMQVRNERMLTPAYCLDLP